MREYSTSTGNDPASDPLERLVEAFVEQSVPQGPDAATQRRLLTAMGAATRSGRPPTAVIIDSQSAEKPRVERLRRWPSHPSNAVRRFAGLAAAVALLAVGGILALAMRGDSRKPVADASTGAAASAASETSKQLARVFEEYLAVHGDHPSDPAAVNELLARIIRTNPRLSQSQSWRFAQQHLSYALEQPEFIGVSVGVLGTLPWTTSARF